jgi:hypothetical protein
MQDEAKTQDEVQKEQESGKIYKKFDQYLNKLTAILGGTELLTPVKVGPSNIHEVIAKLAKDEKEAALAKFEADAKALIQKKRDHDRTMSDLKKEFKKKEQESMKKWNEEAEKLFRQVDDIVNIEKSYFRTLKSAVEGNNSLEQDDDKPQNIE